MNKPFLSLSVLEIFFIATTIFSLFLNLFQLMIWWRDKKNLYNPVLNHLRGVFNDIKQKNISIYALQQRIFHNTNPHQDLNTLKWEYYNTMQLITSYLIGFQESVVSVIVSLNPKDKEGKEAFRASDYGLTESEKEIKSKSFEKFMNQQSARSQ